MEAEMRVSDAIRGIFAKLAKSVATLQRSSRFECGDCDISERCGQLPSDDCIPQAAQIERDGDRPRPQPPGGYQATY